MILFGKQGTYVKINDVIEVLENEMKTHHYASRSSVDCRDAVRSAIRAVKLFHIHKYPKFYMVKKRVFNDKAKKLLEYEAIRKADEEQE